MGGAAPPVVLGGEAGGGSERPRLQAPPPPLSAPGVRAPGPRGSGGPAQAPRVGCAAEEHWAGAGGAEATPRAAAAQGQGSRTQPAAPHPTCSLGNPASAPRPSPLFPGLRASPSSPNKKPSLEPACPPQGHSLRCFFTIKLQKPSPPPWRWVPADHAADLERPAGNCPAGCPPPRAGLPHPVHRVSPTPAACLHPADAPRITDFLK